MVIDNDPCLKAEAYYANDHFYKAKSNQDKSKGVNEGEDVHITIALKSLRQVHQTCDLVGLWNR